MPHEQRTHVEPIVDLYPGRAFVAHVTPGHPGALTVSAAVGADPAQVAAELRDGAGVVRPATPGRWPGSPCRPPSRSAAPPIRAGPCG
jgi:hypothetical protein